MNSRPCFANMLTSKKSTAGVDPARLRGSLYSPQTSFAELPLKAWTIQTITMAGMHSPLT